jgi:hypothetical protein
MVEEKGSEAGAPAKVEPEVSTAEQEKKGGRRRGKAANKDSGVHPFQAATPQRMGDSQMHASELGKGGVYPATPKGNLAGASRYSVEVEPVAGRDEDPPFSHPVGLPKVMPMWQKFLLFFIFMLSLLFFVGGLAAGMSSNVLTGSEAAASIINGTAVYFSAGDGSAGYFSAGTASAGVFSIGSSLSFGIFSLGFVSMGLVSFGFCSVGIFSIGVFSVGVITSGHIVLGLWAWGTYSFYSKGGRSLFPVRRIAPAQDYEMVEQDVESQGEAAPPAAAPHEHFAT